PDLKKAMHGPSQLLGEFRYDVKKDHTDTWENAVSETALLQREAEDTAWLKHVTGADGRVDQALGGDYVLGDRFIVADGNQNDRDHIVTAEDAAQWRQAYYDRRAEAIREKLAKNLYRGSLVKTGEGP
ncbi:serine protease A, partial [gut metagenome]